MDESRTTSPPRRVPLLKDTVRALIWFQGAQSFGILGVLLLLVVVAGVLSPVFLRPSNILNILRQISITGIISLGMTLVIISAGIDLSVGAVVGLVSVFSASFQYLGVAPVLALGLCIGAGAGLVNGLGIVYGRIPALIMTLATMYMARGLAFLYSGGTPLYGIRSGFIAFGNGFTLGIPNSALYFGILIGVFAVLLGWTPLGRYTLAIGSNVGAAALSGVRVGRLITLLYVISGILAGFSGLVYTGQLGIGLALAGQGYELSAIAAVVIGGTSLFGGQGSILGTFLGAAVVGAAGNLLNLLGVNPTVQDFIKGLIILLAVLINRERR